jgi:hypothetical protein
MENTSSRFRLKDDEVELLIEYRAIKQEANELGLRMDYRFTAILIILLCLMAFFGGPVR